MALDFDGINDKVTIDHTGASLYFFAVNQQFTITLWIKFTTLSASGDILQCWNQALNNYSHVLYIESSKFKWRRDDAGNNPYSISANVALSADTWYFVAVGWDGSNAWIRVNGGAQYTVAVGNTDNPTYRIVLGEIATAAWFNGQMSEFTLYHRTLSVEEILSDMYRYVIPDSTVKGLWRMDEGAMNLAPGGLDCTDISGNGNRGTCGGGMTDSDYVAPPPITVLTE